MLLVGYLPNNFELVASADELKVGALYCDWFVWAQKVLDNLKGVYKFLEHLETVQMKLEGLDGQELHKILQQNILCVDKVDCEIGREIFYAVICEENMNYTNIDEEIKRWYWQYVCRYSFVEGELYGSVLW